MLLYRHVARQACILVGLLAQCAIIDSMITLRLKNLTLSLFFLVSLIKLFCELVVVATRCYQCWYALYLSTWSAYDTRDSFPFLFISTDESELSESPPKHILLTIIFTAIVVSDSYPSTSLSSEMFCTLLGEE